MPPGRPRATPATGDRSAAATRCGRAAAGWRASLRSPRLSERRRLFSGGPPQPFRSVRPAYARCSRYGPQVPSADVRESRVVSNLGALGLAIAEVGTGRPVLLVHGFTGAKEEFTDLATDLAADGWHAVTVDLRGHGGSDQPDDQEAY